MSYAFGLASGYGQMRWLTRRNERWDCYRIPSLVVVSLLVPRRGTKEGVMLRDETRSDHRTDMWVRRVLSCREPSVSLPIRPQVTLWILLLRYTLYVKGERHEPHGHYVIPSLVPFTPRSLWSKRLLESERQYHHLSFELIVSLISNLSSRWVCSGGVNEMRQTQRGD